MELPASNVIYETFIKNGVKYDCIIAPSEASETNQSLLMRFHVMLRNVFQPDYIDFWLQPKDGHWMPDNTQAVDPWLADTIGYIILNNY